MFKSLMVYHKQSHHPNSVNWWRQRRLRRERREPKQHRASVRNTSYFLHLGGWYLSSGPDMAVIADPKTWYSVILFKTNAKESKH